MCIHQQVLSGCWRLLEAYRLVSGYSWSSGSETVFALSSSSSMHHAFFKLHYSLESKWRVSANYLQNPLAFQLGDKHFSLLTTYQEV